MDIGRKIKNLRTINKLSQDELARKLQINRNYLSRIETGKSEPSSSILISLSQLFNISIDSLLDLKEKNKTLEEKIITLNEKIKHLDNEDIDFLIKIVNIMNNDLIKNI